MTKRHKKNWWHKPLKSIEDVNTNSFGGLTAAQVTLIKQMGRNMKPIDTKKLTKK